MSDPVRIDIKSTFDRKGTDEANRALNETGKAAEKATTAANAAAGGIGSAGKAAEAASRDMRKMGEAGGAATQIFTGLQQAGNGGIGVITGLSTAVRGLIQVVTAGTGPLGILLAALGLLGGAFLALKDKIAPARDELGKTADEATRAADLIKQAKDEAEALGKTRLETLRGEIQAVRTDVDEALASFSKLQQASAAYQRAETQAKIAEVRASNLPEEEKAKRVSDLQFIQRSREIFAPVSAAERETQLREEEYARAQAREDAARAGLADVGERVRQREALGGRLQAGLQEAIAGAEQANAAANSFPGAFQPSVLRARDEAFATLVRRRQGVREYQGTQPQFEAEAEADRKARQAELDAALQARMEAGGRLANARGNLTIQSANANSLFNFAERESVANLTADDRRRQEARDRELRQQGIGLGRDVEGAVRGIDTGVADKVRAAAEALRDGASGPELDKLAEELTAFAKAAVDLKEAQRREFSRLYAELGRLRQQLTTAKDAQ